MNTDNKEQKDDEIAQAIANLMNDAFELFTKHHRVLTQLKNRANNKYLWKSILKQVSEQSKTHSQAITDKTTSKFNTLINSFQIDID